MQVMKTVAPQALKAQACEQHLHEPFQPFYLLHDILPSLQRKGKYSMLKSTLFIPGGWQQPPLANWRLQLIVQELFLHSSVAIAVVFSLRRLSQQGYDRKHFCYPHPGIKSVDRAHASHTYKTSCANLRAPSLKLDGGANFHK